MSTTSVRLSLIGSDGEDIPAQLLEASIEKDAFVLRVFNIDVFEGPEVGYHSSLHFGPVVIKTSLASLYESMEVLAKSAFREVKVSITEEQMDEKPSQNERGNGYL